MSLSAHGETMADTRIHTLTELERQAETRRAELAQTVDEIHNRVSPGAIKADVRNYARGRMQMIEQRMRENPLQTVAIAAGVAYPVWRMIGRIPAPLLLIGAGLALSRRGGGNGDPVQGRYGEEVPDPERYGASPGGRGVTDKLSEAASGLAEKASETMEDVRGMASEKMESLAGTLSSGYQSGRQAAAGAVSQIEDSYNRTRDEVIDLIDRHPLLAGAVVFAVGGMIAASLPVTRQENRLLGDTSDELKRRTQDMASEGLEQAKSVARQVYEDTASQVREQGLTPEVAASTVHKTVEAAREAMDRTMQSTGGAEPDADSARPPRSP